MPNAKSNRRKDELEISHHIDPGDIGHIICLHGTLYAQEYGYDQTFEAYVANGLAKFVKAFNPDKDRIWMAKTDDRIVGCVAVVKHSELVAQLRWFLVHPDYREIGVGGGLLKKALRFCRKCLYKSVFLWTTSELVEASRLYTRFGFQKVDQKTHQIWGKKVTEEKYDLSL